jgi:hypothetical protein
MIAPAATLADGDPASDILLAQTIFYGADSGLTTAQAAQLQARLVSDAAHGHPLKVAVIASPNDLGAITAAWHKPQAYAKFLGTELSFVYHGTLLVVMPDGAGLATIAKTVTPETPPPLPAGTLAQQTMNLVDRLSPTAARGAKPGASPGRPHGTGDPAALLVLVLGAAAITAAAILSVRARPLRTRRRGG